ncbi:hypothetical protein M758_2G181500 [Ceratodon purpureus]|nr:hypothetical protein M758_2G181500 [Ceratodon purpureus]
MKRSSHKNSHQSLLCSQPEERPIVTTWRINGSNLLKHAQNKLNFPCALFSTMFILWWIQLIWNSSHFNIVGRHGLYVKHTNALSKSTLAANERRMHISNPRKASWDLFGSPKSPSLYTKFNIDGEVYNLEIDTGSFLTWFRCNYKLYQEKTVSNTDPSCKKVTGKHFRSKSLSQLQTKDEGPCLYNIVYQDNSHSDGVIVKSIIETQITDIVTGVSGMHLDATLLGCSFKDSNPNGEYKDAIDGLLGLGRSTHGIQVSLLEHGIPLCFGFCFKDFFNKKDETKVGFLFFGTHDLDYKGQIKWVDIPEYYIFGDEYVAH